MKNIIVICEGQTEQVFCNELLAPYFRKKNITITAPRISVSNGGIVRWKILKKEINEYLKRNSNQTFVTTFIDYYGLHLNLGYPKNKEVTNINERKELVIQIETAMKAELDETLNYRFIPYIQLHEFESLLFSQLETFEKWFEPKEFTDKKYFEQMKREGIDPELVNNGKETAPSKRLKKMISSYDKITHGNILALEIGLEHLRNKCKHFDMWITKLEKI